MRIKKMIELLQAKGFKVVAKKRADYGYDIVKINGKSFTGRQGQAYARELLGIELTQNMQKHIKRLTKVNKSRRRVPALPSEVINKLNKINKNLRKLDELSQAKGDNIDKVGRVSRKVYRYILKEKGLKQAEDYLDTMLRYSEGLANQSGFYSIVQRIKEDSESPMLSERTREKLREIYNELNEIVNDKENTFKEEDLIEIKRLIYGVETKEVKAELFYQRVKSIINAYKNRSKKL